MSRFVATMVAVLVLALTSCAGLSACDPRPTGGPPNPVQPAPSGHRQELAKMPYEKPTDAVLRKTLTAMQYRVTQKAATEPPFSGPYWDEHRSGIYVDVVTGEPLFSSNDKFDSGTGWPSFVRAVDGAAIDTRVDESGGMTRVEVLSRVGNSHLGHRFDDGPAPTGLRYCINSAALRFVAVDQLQAQGYGAYLPMFGKTAAVAPSDSATASAKHNACATPEPGQQAGCASTFEVAYLAGGCFWGMQEILRGIPGVVETSVGYTGGTTSNPTYEDVHAGRTGHTEAVKVVFDPRELSYSDLLERWFFRMHDPTTPNRQGNDVGSQYRSAIFYTTESQHQTAEAVKARLDASGKWPLPLTTEIAAAGPYTLAEGYHQDYLQKNPGGYTCHYLR